MFTQVSDIVPSEAGNIQPQLMETTNFDLCSPFNRLLKILGHCSGSVCEKDALKVGIKVGRQSDNTARRRGKRGFFFTQC